MSRTIVVCYDGTGNEYGRHNTNVVATFESIVRDADQAASNFTFLAGALHPEELVARAAALGQAAVAITEGPRHDRVRRGA